MSVGARLSTERRSVRRYALLIRRFASIAGNAAIRYRRPIAFVLLAIGALWRFSRTDWQVLGSRTVPIWEAAAIAFTTEHLITSLVIAAVILMAILWLVPKWQIRKLLSLPLEQCFDRENESRKTLAQVIGGVVLIAGLFSTTQTLSISQKSLAISQNSLTLAERGQITDRYTKAIAQLADSSQEVRIGGIYALEQIARDAPKEYHWTIMEVLSAYVREKATNSALHPKTKPGTRLVVGVGPPEDVQVALTVIGRREIANDHGQINLRLAHLEGARMPEAHLEGADLIGTNLTLADLHGAHLEKAILEYATLDSAVLSGGHLENANLSDAHLRNTQIQGGHLQQAFLAGADMTQAVLSQANLDEAYLNGAKLRYAFLGGASLQRTNLARIDFYGANLGEAKFDGAYFGKDLRGTQGLTQSQLDVGRGDEGTQLPFGLHIPAGWLQPHTVEQKK